MGLRLHGNSLLEQQSPPSGLQPPHTVLSDARRSQGSKIEYLRARPDLAESGDPDVQWWVRHLQNKARELAPVTPESTPSPLPAANEHEATQLRQWLSGAEMPTAPVSSWQRLGAAVDCFPRFIRHGIDEAQLQASLDAVARWLDQVLASLDSTPAAAAAQAHPGADLLCLVWSREIAPRSPTLLASHDTASSLQALLHCFLRAALHPALLPRQGQASLEWIRRIGVWCKALCLPADRAMELLRRALPRVTGLEAKAALVDMLLPSLRSGPLVARASLMPLLQAVLHPALLHGFGLRTTDWIAQMRTLCLPMRLSAEGAQSLLQSVLPAANQAEADALRAWLEPFARGEAPAFGHSHRGSQSLADAIRSADAEAPPPDEIDRAVWGGLRQGALLQLITALLKDQRRLQEIKSRLRFNVFAYPEPGQDGVLWATMEELLGPDRYAELVQALDKTLLHRNVWQAPPRTAGRSGTPSTPPDPSGLADAVQEALDDSANADVEQLIRQGVGGEPLLREMLERCKAGAVSTAQVRQWADGIYHVSPTDAAPCMKTMREILGEYYHDVLLNVIPND